MTEPGRRWCVLGCDRYRVTWGTVHADLYLAHGLVTTHGPGVPAILSAFREAQKVRRADNHAHIIHRTDHGPWHTPAGESLDLLAGQMRRAREPGASFAYVYGIPDTAAGPWPHGDLADGRAPVVEPVQPSLFDLGAS